MDRVADYIPQKGLSESLKGKLRGLFREEGLYFVALIGLQLFLGVFEKDGSILLPDHNRIGNKLFVPSVVDHKL
jgi:hypothetical protein